jgi:hypothetical protein
MKFLGKSFAVAAMALAVSTAAEARIQSIGDNKPTGSELIFNLVNYTAEKSYTLDLGITTAQYDSSASQSINFSAIMNADSNFQSFLSSYSAGHNVTWGVSGGNGFFDTEEAVQTFGFYTTSVTNTPASIDTDGADINNTMGKWDGLVSNINPVGQPATNLSYFRNASDLGYTGVFGNDFQTALPFAAQGALGQEMWFVKEKVNNDDFITGELVVLPGKWNFNIANGVASLGYSAAPSEVPVPAAVWMFGTGLLGLLGLNRRKVA